MAEGEFQNRTFLVPLAFRATFCHPLAMVKIRLWSKSVTSGRILTLLYIWGLAVTLSGSALAQEFLERDWDLDEGLPSTCIFAIARTHDGYLWLGTARGLVRFDGERFVAFGAETIPVLKDQRVICLTVDARGILWVGTSGGALVRYEQGKFSAVNLQQFPSVKRINAVLADGAGTLWLGTSGAGLIRFRDGSWTRITAPKGEEADDIWQIQSDAQDRVWCLAAPGNAGWVDGDQRHVLALSAGWRNTVQVIAPSRDGGLWLAALKGITGSRILKCKGGVVTEDEQAYPWSQSNERARVVALMEDLDGRLWCGTSGEGVFLREADHRWRMAVDELPLPHADVLCLFQDHPGAVFIGTRTSGLHQLLPRVLSVLHLPHPYRQHVILTACVRRDGSIWAGTDGAGVIRWTGSDVEHLGKDQGVAATQVYSLLEDAHSNLWAGTSAGLLKFNEKRFDRVASPALQGKIAVLYEDPQQHLWAGSDSGLLDVGDNGRIYDQRNGLPPGQIVSATQDKAGRLWVAVEGRGLYVQSGDRFQLWKARNGWPIPIPHRDDGLAAQPLLADADGSMWVGLYGHCLVRVEGDQFSRWSWQTEGLPSNHLLALQEDASGNLWCSSENGIFCYGKTALRGLNAKRGDRLVPLRLTRAEGLPYKVCSGSGQPTGTKTPDGRIWFPDGPALVSFDPRAVPFNPVTRPPIIEEMRVDDHPLSLSRGRPIQITSGARSYQFTYSSPNDVAPQHLRFRCRLEGLDKDWTAGGSERSVKYGALSPGNYTFRVMARNNFGAWNEEVTALAFTVVPRWWETVWFRLVLGAGLFGALGLAARQRERARSRSKLAELERSRALEQERNRIARDIHDDLGASLTQVALLSKMAGDSASSSDELHTQTQQITKTAHEMVQSLETIVWAVRPENDSLKSLVEYMNRRADELFENLPRQYLFAVRGAIPSISLHAETRHNVYLAYREALTNALKHSGATRFRIELLFQSATCRIVISDDGKGFHPDAVRVGGTGLRNMRMRMEQVGGGCEWRTGDGNGTTVTLHFPIQGPSSG